MVFLNLKSRLIGMDVGDRRRNWKTITTKKTAKERSLVVVNRDQREALEDSLSPAEGYGNGAEATTSNAGYVRELKIANAAEEGWGKADDGGGTFEIQPPLVRNRLHKRKLCTSKSNN